MDTKFFSHMHLRAYRGEYDLASWDEQKKKYYIPKKQPVRNTISTGVGVEEQVHQMSKSCECRTLDENE